jgi:GNAT superfamily N-acetyltransferase
MDIFIENDRSIFVENSIDTVINDVIVYSGSNSVILDSVNEIIKSETAAHVWQNFSCGEEVLAYEESLRKTHFFFYTLVMNGTCRLLGVATVATSVKKNFTDTGFPVIARAFVFPEFRGTGIYQLMLKHRIEWCKRTLGSELCGIHLGTDTIKVESCARALGFAQIGKQKLLIKGSPIDVKAFLLFEPIFRQNLLSEPSDSVSMQRFLKFCESIPLDEWGIHEIQ